MKVLFVLASVILAITSRSAGDDLLAMRAIADDQTRWVAHSKGAEAKECFQVVDPEGGPVVDAKVRCTFWLGGGHSGWRDVCGVTDTNGLCAIIGMSRANLEYFVAKDGYYQSHGNVDYINTLSVPAVVDGKWQPYGETRMVVLKRILHPQEMLGPKRTPQRKRSIYDKWLGFDLEKGDFLPPIGNGCCSDMLVRFHLKGQMPNDWSVAMDVSFTNHPYAGAYRLKKDVWSDMKSVYCADTNAVYATDFSFAYHHEKGIHPFSEKLGKDEYMVFRTRTKVDGEGRLISARYGKLYGPWDFEDAGGTRIYSVFLNVRDGDVNLEDIRTVEAAKKNFR